MSELFDFRKCKIVTTEYFKKEGSLTTYPGSPNYNLWMLGSACSWISHTNTGTEFLEFSNISKKLFKLHGFVSQGRKDCDQWIQFMRIQTTLNGLDWNLEHEKVKANCDKDGYAYVILKKPKFVSGVKFDNFEFHGHMCMRVGFIIEEC